MSDFTGDFSSDFDVENIVYVNDRTVTAVASGGESSTTASGGNS